MLEATFSELCTNPDLDMDDLILSPQQAWEAGIVIAPFNGWRYWGTAAQSQWKLTVSLEEILEPREPVPHNLARGHAVLTPLAGTEWLNAVGLKH